MKSDAENARLTALVETIAACVAAEALVILLLRQVAGSTLGAAVLSVLVLGPVSLWLAPPLYRYLKRENE